METLEHFLSSPVVLTCLAIYSLIGLGVFTYCNVSWLSYDRETSGKTVLSGLLCGPIVWMLLTLSFLLEILPFFRKDES